MNQEMYRNFILTVIAICLVWLCITGMDVIPNAIAQNSQPAAPGQVLDVRVVDFSPAEGANWQPVSVRTTDQRSPLYVELVRTADVNVRNEVDIKSSRIRPIYIENTR